MNSQRETFEAPRSPTCSKDESSNVFQKNGEDEQDLTENEESALESMAAQPGSGGIDALSPRSEYLDADDRPIDLQMELTTYQVESNKDFVPMEVESLEPNTDESVCSESEFESALSPPKTIEKELEEDDDDEDDEPSFHKPQTSPKAPEHNEFQPNWSAIEDPSINNPSQENPSFANSQNEEQLQSSSSPQNTQSPQHTDAFEKGEAIEEDLQSLKINSHVKEETYQEETIDFSQSSNGFSSHSPRDLKESPMKRSPHRSPRRSPQEETIDPAENGDVFIRPLPLERLSETSLNNNPSPQIKLEMDSSPSDMQETSPPAESSSAQTTQESDEQQEQVKTEDELETLTKEEKLMLFHQQRQMKLALLMRLRELNEESIAREEHHQLALRYLPTKQSPTQMESQRPVKDYNSDSSDSSDYSDDSDDSEDSAATTEESDVEESVVFDAKIMQEQKKFTARQLDEDADMRRVEAQRLIEIKNIQRVEDIIQKCNETLTTKEEEIKAENEESELEIVENIPEESCARVRPFSFEHRRKRNFIRIPELRFKSRHHPLDPDRLSLSDAITSYLHNFNPSNELQVPEKSSRGRTQRYSQDKEKKRRSQYSTEDTVYFPPSASLCTNIELLTCKEIDTPSFRIIDSDDERSSDDLGSDTEPPEDEDYITMHMAMEKKEKMRYYHGAITQSKKKKKILDEPRVASPKREGYFARSMESYKEDGIGWKIRNYPLEPKPKKEHRSKKKRRTTRERGDWRSSKEGTGLRLKISLKKH
ncbi:Oidioi.mRNA.OKI2018_I69.chr1.g1280.t1.cds [Oikopleura dioica]|uniref:Oidioi.mRNA.OKI2018_I69.chr1.g1280.t1.cds n=1 Tax=Oikopleura dioica TaxID=34765 RepID=A0ABN7SRN5_OIKDI|nr:Oidioi.mRNA.OKI2018_I69.chr1.g1280.t1.cds [Oikopleura dioica]